MNIIFAPDWLLFPANSICNAFLLGLRWRRLPRSSMLKCVCNAFNIGFGSRKNHESWILECVSNALGIWFPSSAVVRIAGHSELTYWISNILEIQFEFSNPPTEFLIHSQWSPISNSKSDPRLMSIHLFHVYTISILRALHLIFLPDSHNQAYKIMSQSHCPPVVPKGQLNFSCMDIDMTHGSSAALTANPIQRIRICLSKE